MSDIKLTIGGDSSEFQKVASNVVKTGGSIKSAFNTPLTSLNLGQIGLMGMALKGKALVDELDDIGDASDKLGVSTKYFQEISQAAKLGGSDVETIAAATKKLTLNLSEMKAGDDKDTTLKQLGLDASKLIAMPIEERFKAVASAISQQDDQTVKLNAAFTLLGKTGTELIPAMDNLKNATKDIIPDETIKNAGKLNDAIDILSQKFKSNLFKGGEFLKDFATGELFTDPLQKGDQAKLDAEAKQREENAKKAAEQKKIQDAAAAQDKVDDSIKKIQLETELIDLKNKGLEREAEVKKQIAAIEEKTKTKLTDRQKEKVTIAAETLFNTRENKISEGRGMAQQTVGWNSRVAMGANLPGKVDSDRLINKGLELDQKRNEFLKTMAERSKKQDTGWDSKNLKITE